MDLNFKKEGNYYVAEFKAAGDFNLHLERNQGSIIGKDESTWKFITDDDMASLIRNWI